MKIAVLGAGAWGTALASHAARQDHEVCVWAYEAAVAEDIRDHQTNSVYLSGVKLPPMRATSDIGEAARGAELIIFVPPAQHLRRVATAAAPHVGPGARIAVASKGIEESTLKLMSEVVPEVMPEVSADRLAFISGPNFAREVASGLPTDAVVASSSPATAEAVQHALHSPMLRFYTSSDPIGVEVGGAIKNVIAVAAGACDGLGMGTNARAALITRGLAEITRLGVTLGADPLTFLGMAGVGDLVLTCTGDLSRNRRLGLKLAEGVDPKAYLAGQKAVAEGFTTSAAAWALAQKIGCDMPITEQVYHVLHKGRPLLEALKLLVTRDQKAELSGIRRG